MELFTDEFFRCHHEPIKSCYDPESCCQSDAEIPASLSVGEGDEDERPITYRYCSSSRVSMSRTRGRPYSSAMSCSSALSTLRPLRGSKKRSRRGHGVTWGRGVPVRRDVDIKPKREDKKRASGSEEGGRTDDC